MVHFPENKILQPLLSPYNFHTKADVLRLDLIHPVISGNKWFKLKEYLREAEQFGKNVIVTFGGAYSNHIAATAAAVNLCGWKSIGIIRGERPAQLSHTLKEATDLGMQLVFVPRKVYKNKTIPAEVNAICNEKDLYIINEGGYGAPGKSGAKQILNFKNSASYTHIIAAAGTGTTLAGLIAASGEHQQVIGVSVLKNNFSLTTEINNLLTQSEKKEFTILNDYHFGGYAKYNDALLNFMNKFYEETKIPTDFVYTAKLFYAVEDLLRKNLFSAESKLLIIHSGGLQGNRSLSKGKLIF